MTLFGHSTGGADALYLMTSPLAEGLFHGAISQSGSPMNDTRTLAGEEARGPRLEELLGIEDSDTRRAPGAGGERLGAYHGAEVAYVFDNLAAESWTRRQGGDEDLADSLADYWAAFARGGDPNLDRLPHWPSYGAGEYLEFGQEVVVRTEPDSKECRLWEQWLETELGGS